MIEVTQEAKDISEAIIGIGLEIVDEVKHWKVGRAEADLLVQNAITAAEARGHARSDAERDALVAEVAEVADAVVQAFELFNDAEHNRSHCPECGGDGEWGECEPCCDRIGGLLNTHLLAIEAYKTARLKASPVPELVYWSAEGGNFYGQVSRRGQGREFFNEWFPRRDEFPTEASDGGDHG